MRDAAERSGQDLKFTAHPATWLNAGRWQDETAAPANVPIIDQIGNPVDSGPPTPNRPPPANAHTARVQAQLDRILKSAGGAS